MAPGFGLGNSIRFGGLIHFGQYDHLNDSQTLIRNQITVRYR